MARTSRFGGRRGSEVGNDPAAFAGALRERIYATLTGIATLTLLLIYADEESVWSAIVSVVLAMGTLWLASLVSEIMAHGVTRNHPNYDGTAGQSDVGRDILYTASQSLSTMVVPVAVLLLSLTGLWSLRTALILAIASLMLTLVVAAFFAVRKSDIPFWGRVLVVVVELALGGVVIVGKVFAH